MAGNKGAKRAVDDTCPDNVIGDNGRQVSELKKENIVLREELQARQEELDVQAAELEAQLEELRANNEELERQIEERRRAEEALQLTQFALDNFQDSAIWVMQNGNIAYVNRAACDTLGYSREELLSMHIYDIDPNYTPERFMELWPEKLQGRYLNFETRHVTRDGRSFPVEVTSCYTRFGDKELLITFDRDITERKRAEKELRQSERRLADIINHLPDATFAVDREGRVIAWNHAIEEMTGVKAADMLCKGDYEYALHLYGSRQPILIDLIFASDEEIGRYTNVRREGSAITAEIRRPMLQGNDIALWVMASPFFDENGNPVGAIESIRDITEHKQIEEALRESEENLRVLAETTKAGISLYQGDKSIYANPALEKMSGYTSAELSSTAIWDYVHPDYRELVMKRAMDRERGLSVPEVYEFPVITKYGEMRWVEVSAGLIMYRGEPTRIATYFDITGRKRAEEKLKKSQYILAKSQEMAHVGNWAWNPLTGEVNGSDESYRIFGYAPEEVRHTIDSLIERIHPEDRAMLEGLLESARSEGKQSMVDYRIIRPDGSMRYVSALADRIVRDDDGKVRWVYGIIQDITERKQTEKALAEAKARAELYIDLMAHDINNMNQSAQGYLELASQTLEMDGKIGQDGKVLIKKPLQAVQSSSKLISNVRKLQQLADEGMKTRPVDLHDLFEELKSLDFQAGDKDARISMHEVPRCSVEGSDLLQDVFFNLISNAVKHSLPGKPVAIDVRVNRVNEDGRIYCRCTVEDDGPGVPDELKPRLFQRFQRGKTQVHGKGLGLYLVRTLVEGYHGKVWVEDRVSGDHTKGARFVVMLPAIEM